MALAQVKESVASYRCGHPQAKILCKQANPQPDGAFKVVFNWAERGVESNVEHGTFPPRGKAAFYQWARYGAL